MSTQLPLLETALSFKTAADRAVAIEAQNNRYNADCKCDCDAPNGYEDAQDVKEAPEAHDAPSSKSKSQSHSPTSSPQTPVRGNRIGFSGAPSSGAIADSLKPPQESTDKGYTDCTFAGDVNKHHENEDADYWLARNKYITELQASKEYICAGKALGNVKMPKVDAKHLDPTTKKCQPFDATIKAMVNGGINDTAYTGFLEKYNNCLTGTDASDNPEDPVKQSESPGDGETPEEKDPDPQMDGNDAPPVNEENHVNTQTLVNDGNPDKPQTGGAPIEKRKIFILHRWRIVHRFGRFLYVNVKGRLVRLSQLKHVATANASKSKKSNILQ